VKQLKEKQDVLKEKAEKYDNLNVVGDAESLVKERDKLKSLLDHQVKLTN